MKTIFIVPYRERPQHKFFFIKHLLYLMEDVPKTDFQILFIHQCDNRNFNRGAIKNIGFIVAKRLYPETYKDITFVFHDIDTLPFFKLFNYETVHSSVKHFYGFETALGGIFAIKGSDFEKTNGFPNYWGWGMEDACIQQRCLKKGLIINRDEFHPIGNPNILQFFDGVNRLVSKRDHQRMKYDNGFDGLSTIHRLVYQVVNDGQSLNPNDNKFIFPNDANVNMVNVTSFFTAITPEKDSYILYDLRDPIQQVIKQNKQNNSTTVTDFKQNDWCRIPPHNMTDQLLINRTQTLHNRR